MRENVRSEPRPNGRRGGGSFYRLNHRGFIGDGYCCWCVVAAEFSCRKAFGKYSRWFLGALGGRGGGRVASASAFSESALVAVSDPWAFFLRFQSMIGVVYAQSRRGKAGRLKKAEFFRAGVGGAL